MDVVEVVVNCTTQATRAYPLGADALADIQARQQQAEADAAAQAQVEQQRQDALGVVQARASEDPAFAALLTLIGGQSTS